MRITRYDNDGARQYVSCLSALNNMEVIYLNAHGKRDLHYVLCSILKNRIPLENITPKDISLLIMYACDADKVDVLIQIINHLRTIENAIRISVLLTDAMFFTCSNISSSIFMTILENIMPLSLGESMHLYKRLIKYNNTECLLYIHRNFPDFILSKYGYKKPAVHSKHRYKTILHEASEKGDNMSAILNNICAE
jgi:hypothetical protein